jgi:hypothetical protein
VIAVAPILDQCNVRVGRRNGFSDGHGRRVYHRRAGAGPASHFATVRGCWLLAPKPELQLLRSQP